MTSVLTLFIKQNGLKPLARFTMDVPEMRREASM